MSQALLGVTPRRLRLFRALPRPLDVGLRTLQLAVRRACPLLRLLQRGLGLAQRLERLPTTLLRLPIGLRRSLLPLRGRALRNEARIQAEPRRREIFVQEAALEQRPELWIDRSHAQRLRRLLERRPAQLPPAQVALNAIERRPVLDHRLVQVGALLSRDSGLLGRAESLARLHQRPHLGRILVDEGVE